MDPILRVKNLTKRFRRVEALSELSLEIAPGEAVALWGPNGAGKTTLLRCLLGILPYEGEIRLLGLDPRRQGREIRAKVGYVPQQIRLHSDQTVWETIGFYAQLRGIPTGRAADLVGAWGLGDTRGAQVQNLSGGMRQRLMLAIALLSDPPVLLLDEPTSNLDIATRRDFSAALGDLKKSGRTLFFCSHRLSEIRNLADKVVSFDGGRKVFEGKPSGLAAALSEWVELRIFVSEPDRLRAVECLARRGMAPVSNGEGLLVRVPAGQKAEPLRILLEERIGIVDFDAEPVPGERQ